MSLESKLESGNPNKDNDNRLQVSSKGKRLFALLLDFIFALLFANTLVQVFREEHWDLVVNIFHLHTPYILVLQSLLLS